MRNLEPQGCGAHRGFSLLGTNRLSLRCVIVAVICTAFAVNSGLCAATSDPVLDQFIDLFIKKGFVTPQEVEKVKAEAEAMRTNGVPPLPESRFQISKGTKKLELFGDVRMRYEDRQAVDPYDGSIDLQRLRYSLRMGLRGDVFDNFYFGLRLDTSANPRSSWVTLATSSSGTPYQGPFGKSTSGIYVGQAYIGWRPLDWANLTVGRLPNPIYTTPMIWNPTLNPEGAAERFMYPVGQADFFANFGQFLYQDTNPTHTVADYFNLGYTNSKLPFLVAYQGGVDYHFTKKVNFKVAPVLYQYIGNGVNTTPPGNSVAPGFSNPFVGQGSTVNFYGNQHKVAWSGYPQGNYDGFYSDQTGINNLLVLDFPFELNFKMEKVNLRIFGDFAKNLDGAQRAKAAFNGARTAFTPNSPNPPNTVVQIPSPQTGDTSAYQFGFGLGSSGLAYGPMQGLVYGTTSKKHAWEFRTYWQHIEQYALDPNLLDTDFFEGSENMQGVYAAFAYGFNENIIATFRYGYASRINSLLGTGGSGQDIPQMNPIKHYQLFQFDLTCRF